MPVHGTSHTDNDEARVRLRGGTIAGKKDRHEVKPAGDVRTMKEGKRHWPVIRGYL